MNKTIDEIRSAAEARLSELLAAPDANESLLNAMRYSVTAGGKRLRPILNVLANSLLDGDMRETLDIACAIEMIHTYSLIHDDLPALDNDELRRGKPTSHVVFGEAFAILAGDALLNYAFEVMLQAALRYPDNLQAHARALSIVAQGAGVSGMITGQCGDIENEGQILTERELVYIHDHKTGALICAALLSGLELCSPGEDERAALELYGRNVGLIFQITDDILDITGDASVLGKSIGKDREKKKFTFPVMYGMEGSMRIAHEKAEEAADALAVFGSRAAPLEALARDILSRNK